MRNSEIIKEIENKSLEARRMLVRISAQAGTVHIGSSLSEIEILATLYSSFLNIKPSNVNNPERDRLILSKGHAALGLYVVLNQHGFIKDEELESYTQDGTNLAVHPVLGSAPGIEATSGALGHGLSIAVGMALAAKRNGWKSRYVVILSDGECDEGSVWEAAMLAGHLKLDNLLVVIDYNKIQSFGRVSEVLELEPFAEKWQVNHWSTLEVDGHDVSDLLESLSKFPNEKGKPTAIIAHTIKGKGISYFEDTLESHYRSIKPQELDEVLKNIS